MIHYRLLTQVVCSLLLFAAVRPASASWIQSPLLTTGYVESHGLARAWHTQISIDGERSKIKHIKLEHDLLLVVTSGGVLHVIDANTGIVHWTTTVGEQRFQTLMAGANANFIA